MFENVDLSSVHDAAKALSNYTWAHDTNRGDTNTTIPAQVLSNVSV